MKFWYSQNLLAWMLLPLSWLFCLLAVLRALGYRRGWLKSHKAAVPVIIIGNISVGGTGKTPLLIAFCERLQQQGVRVGVVSRGYAGHIKDCHDISREDTAQQVGDEPLLIHLRTACPVVIASDRAAAADHLLAHHDCDLILSDDGLQHYRLQRDAELAVIDATRMHGNGFCLPAGPLREPRRRLQTVDMVVFNDLQAPLSPRPAFSLVMTAIINLKTSKKASLQDFFGRQVHAVAGIGYPQRFFEQLRSHGIDVIEHALDDHHVFSDSDIIFGDELPVLMTEKDAVKCRQFATEQCWSVAVSAQFNRALKEEFLHLLSNLGVIGRCADG